MEGAEDIEDGGLILFGKAREFLTLVQQLRSMTSVSITLDPCGEARLLRPLTTLQLDPGDGEMRIVVAASTAVLSGTAAARDWLADEILECIDNHDNDDDDPGWDGEPGIHAHIDAGTGRMAPDGRNLTIVGPVSDD